MRVAFYVYPVAFQSPGGGEILLLKTREYLQKAGQPVTLFNPWEHKLKDFDILHTFGSVKDSLRMMEAARTYGVKNVLSTICWYNWRSAWSTYPNIKTRVLSLARHAAKCFFPCLPSERKKMMQISDLLIPNSESEAAQLQNFFQAPEKKIKIIMNAVDGSFAQAKPDLFIEKYGLKDFVLCVGRIEPRKNQLAMVRALSGIDRTVVFIGDPVYSYKDYYDRCRKEAGKNVRFLGGFAPESELLASAYAACDTFVLASWLETPGLAALEAGLAGAKVVITDQGATREYFGSRVLYAAPSSAGQIRSQVRESLSRPKSNDLRDFILQHYTWQRVAKDTQAAYEQVLRA